MTDGTTLPASLFAYGVSFGLGVALGLAFLWGLWLTVRRLEVTRHPGFLMMGSLFLRLGITLTGFYFISQYGDWQHLLAAVVGFTLPRLLIAHRIRAPGISGEPRP
ncbi:ATP synthase subunit I [Marinobacter sediminum]|uniref:ATP synthase subunit I n=1 Tax=Marinobacter sediminum TaxID=256323 RepID=UPI00202E98AE|nr:ATP synthase subunit I [Marinobacter sediminum]